MTWNYSYPLRLRLAGCRNLDLGQPPYKGIIEEAAWEFNRRSETAYTPKRIRNIQYPWISEITLVLDSANELKSPDRALLLFSKIIIARTPFEPSLQKGRLFVASPMADPPPGFANMAMADVSPELIPDEALLDGLTRFFLSGSDGSPDAEYEKKKAAVDRMKCLALNAGIIDRKLIACREGS